MANLSVLNQTTEELYNEMYSDLMNACGGALYPGDERLIFAKAILLIKAAEYAALNAAARQTWLDSAYGEFLDAMGARYDTARQGSTAATTTLEFYFDNGMYSEDSIPVINNAAVLGNVTIVPDLSSLTLRNLNSDVGYTSASYDAESQTITVSGIDNDITSVSAYVYYAYGADITIPQGTQVTSDSSRFFETLAECAITSGTRSVTVGAMATERGADYNNIPVGTITTVVNLYNVPFTPSVTNIEVTSGGASSQSDDIYRETIRIASNKTTTAGPQDSYRYWALQADASIADVYAWSPEDTNITEYPDLAESVNYINNPNMTGTPGEVFVYLLLENGEIPAVGDNVLSVVENLLDEKRPLTDCVHVLPTRTVDYGDINLTYYTTAADAEKVAANVEAAIAEYKKWQSSKFGRDINPDKLRALILTPEDGVGAQRVNINSPIFTAVKSWEVAITSGNVTVTRKIIADGEVA